MKNRPAIALSALLVAVSLFTIHPFAQEITDANRKIVVKVVPQYPNLARAMRIQGNVRADVLVAPDGKVKSVEVKGGHPLLAQSAQDALRQWKWEPASHETHESVELKFTP
jgi:TonB family protein